MLTQGFVNREGTGKGTGYFVLILMKLTLRIYNTPIHNYRRSFYFNLKVTVCSMIGLWFRNASKSNIRFRDQSPRSRSKNLSGYW